MGNIFRRVKDKHEVYPTQPRSDWCGSEEVNQALDLGLLKFYQKLLD